MVYMARAYLTDMGMPKRFWLWALRHSCRVNNYLPFLKDGLKTSPLELVHKAKPDLRVLFRLFTVGFFHHKVDSNRVHTTFESQTLTGIAIGQASDSNTMEFYSPVTQQIYTSADYKLDPSRTTATIFPQIQYDGGITVGLYTSSSSGGPEPFPPHLEV